MALKWNSKCVSSGNPKHQPLLNGKQSTKQYQKLPKLHQTNRPNPLRVANSFQYVFQK